MITWKGGRHAAALSAALVLTLPLVLAPAAHAAEEDPYVPFVTDFPKPASAQQFVPFVTDFGKEPRLPGRTVVIGPLRPAEPAPVPVAARSWTDVALGAALGLALAGLLALALLGVRKLRGWGDGALADSRPTAGAARS